MYADKMWQVADWLESYAHSLELDVWTSSTVTRASQDPETKKWTVEIERANAEPRSFVVNHLVFAIGFAGGTYKTPQIPGAVGVHAMLDNFARTLLNFILSSVLG
jgi:cation diffusion facilitator CzcD-associated flavoprotein CzcO